MSVKQKFYKFATGYVGGFIGAFIGLSLFIR